MEKTTTDLDTALVNIQTAIENVKIEFEKNFFEEIRDFLDIQHIRLREEQIVKTNNADYVGLKRFIFTAINNLLEIDNKIKTPLFDKLKNDIEQLYNLRDKFISVVKFKEIVFEDGFLKLIPLYNLIYKQLKDLELEKRVLIKHENRTRTVYETLETAKKKTDLDIEKIKKFRGLNADAIDRLAYIKNIQNDLYNKEEIIKNKARDYFNSFFDTSSAKILKDLVVLINVKSYCLDQALWYYAESSVPIQKFFQTARIQGNYCLRTYIDYYLKNLDEESKGKEEEIKFLLQAMKDLDK